MKILILLLLSFSLNAQLEIITAEGRINSSGIFEAKTDTIEGYFLISKDTLTTQIIHGFMTHKWKILSWQSDETKYFDKKWKPIDYLILQFIKK